jgi:hypothetical protein
MVDFESSCVILTLFYVGLTASAVLLGISIHHTVVSLTGYRYMTLPKATEIVRKNAQKMGSHKKWGQTRYYMCYIYINS